MPTQEFQTVLDPEQYFKGLARQEMDFHQALGELVDNALSARHSMPHDEAALQSITIEVIRIDPGKLLHTK